MHVQPTGLWHQTPFMLTGFDVGNVRRLRRHNELDGELHKQNHMLGDHEDGKLFTFRPECCDFPRLSKCN